MDVLEFLIDEEKPMLEAMRQLDKVARKVLFVTRENCFVASLTDGDIRRWILKKGSLDAKVKDIANYSPKALAENERDDAREIMEQHGIEAVPILNGVGAVTSVVFLHDEAVELNGNLHLPVVVMAGGLGTRLYPYTKILPKPLIPIGEIPVVEHIINRFYHSGCEQFYLIVNHKKNMIKAYFNEIEYDYQVEYVDEDKPLGTGGGLALLKEKISESFILTNCDILIKADYQKIYNHHKENGNLITMVCSLKNVKIPYGVIEISDTGEIESMKEKPELSFFTNTGMYIVEPSVISELADNTVIGFPDIIEKHQKAGAKIGVYPISEKSWLDMGQLDELEAMKRELTKNE